MASREIAPRPSRSPSRGFLACGAGLVGITVGVGIGLPHLTSPSLTLASLAGMAALAAGWYLRRSTRAAPSRYGAEEAGAGGSSSDVRPRTGRLLMDRTRFRYFLNWLLLAGAVVVILTGVVVDRLGSQRLHAAPVGRLRRRGAHRPPRGAALAGSPAHSSSTRPRAGILAGVRDAGAVLGIRDPGVPGRARDGAQPARGTASAGAREGRPHPTRRTAIAVVGAGVAGVAVGWTARSGMSPDPYPGGDVGLFYHRQSALGLRGLVSGVVDWGRRPAQYRQVGDGPSVPLPALGAGPAMSVAQALQQRRSLRDYADRAMTTDELAWVIHGATGITQAQAGLRTAPSAGALYPLETYVAVSRVEGIEAGLYHVDVRGRALEPVRNGSVAGDLMVAGLGQDFLRRAPVVLILTGLFQRSRWKYRERHYRYVCWEGGHATQNVYLAAEAAGLGACMVGAFLDGRVNDLARCRRSAGGRTRPHRPGSPLTAGHRHPCDASTGPRQAAPLQHRPWTPSTTGPTGVQSTCSRQESLRSSRRTVDAADM